MVSLKYCKSPNQTVGTPINRSGFSLSINSYTEAPSRAGPGKTNFAPNIAPAYGIPQALTWNIGTTGSMHEELETFATFPELTIQA